ncbi:type VII secretion target [Streptomyces sp. NPDC006332]|uniref:type VII secretion target n=1 Tax=Streptomyces sp. NPDC006332 TaxID=3155456 RepID=UPI0033A30054
MTMTAAQDSTSAPDFGVKKSGLTGQAKQLNDAGDDAGTIRMAIDSRACYDTDTLGGADSAAAFNSYAGAWAAEARTIEDALHELADKVSLAKGAYSDSDGLVETQASGVEVGDSALTTMPTYAERPSALSQY